MRMMMIIRVSDDSDNMVLLVIREYHNDTVITNLCNNEQSPV